jgi:pantothenate synthetase
MKRVRERCSFAPNEDLAAYPLRPPGRRGQGSGARRGRAVSPRTGGDCTPRPRALCSWCRRRSRTLEGAVVPGTSPVLHRGGKLLTSCAPTWRCSAPRLDARRRLWCGRWCGDLNFGVGGRHRAQSIREADGLAMSSDNASCRRSSGSGRHPVPNALDAATDEAYAGGVRRAAALTERATRRARRPRTRGRGVDYLAVVGPRHLRARREARDGALCRSPRASGATPALDIAVLDGGALRAPLGRRARL